MLFRKIESKIHNFLSSSPDKILIVEGARQIGKSFIIRYIGERLFENFIEINLLEDANGPRLFENTTTTEEFYLVLSSIYGEKLDKKENTLIFLDEIQEYPHLFTLLKFLKQEGKYTYICSGSLLGVTLRQTVSIPIGSIKILQMYPLDFEEFLIANGVGEDVLNYLQNCFINQTSPNEAIHSRTMDLFRRYLIVGGMPDAVNEFLASKNIVKIREIQSDIHRLYGDDATKYDIEHKLKIIRIYNLLPSNLSNKKKRLVFKNIEGIKGKRNSDYEDEIDYLINSGVTLETKAISNPKFPLTESEHKNLLKLYLNDVGILSYLLYHNNVKAILDNIESINLGAVYECAVAMELKAHGNKLFYYDNRKNGEVDFLVDDYENLSVLPIEVKSGKDYNVHSAMTRFVNVEDYHIKFGIVLSNGREVNNTGKIVYMPVYMVMYFNTSTTTTECSLL